MNPPDSNDTVGGDGPLPGFPSWYRPRKPFHFGIRSLLLLTLAVCILLSCVVNLPAILGWAYGHWQVGRQYDQCTFEGSQFSLRITAFHERGTLFAAPGSFHRYEVKRSSDWQWRKITMIGFSADPIPRNQFHRLNDSCAYFYREDLFGITRDGGASWTFRGGASGGSAYLQFSAQQGDPNATIESLTIDEDGSGVIRLSNCDYVKRIPLPSQEFETTDYGLTWHEVLPGPL